MKLKRKSIAFFLIILGIISLFLQFSQAEFQIPIFADNLDLLIRALAHSQGNFDVSANRNFGWSLFIAPFLFLIDSDNFLDYSNLVRTLGIAVSTFAIFPTYLLARKFFDEKYSLVAASLLAVEPNLTHIAWHGNTEPLFMIALVGAIYFILAQNKNSKTLYLAFLLAGISFWIRPMGLVMIIVLTIIYFIRFRRSSNLLRYSAYLLIFLIIISPVLVVRELQYGDPFYYHDVEKGFITETSKLHATNIEPVSLSEYIDNNGFDSFFRFFVIEGIYNLLVTLGKVSLPYLTILLPIGAILSLKFSEQVKSNFLYVWILILISSASMLVVFAIIPTGRYLYPIMPFLIIFSTLPIMKITEFSRNPFSKSEKKKKIFIIIIIGIIIISSAIWMSLRYEFPDSELYQERIEFNKFLRDNLKGKIYDDSSATIFFYWVEVVKNERFKTIYFDKGIGTKYEGYTDLTKIQIYGNSFKEIISEGEKLGLDYIVLNGKGQFFNKFMNEVYYDEENYPYLIKIFDSENEGYKRLKVKVFGIDYGKYHEYFN